MTSTHTDFHYNKSTMATYNVEEFYSYCSAVSSSTASITIIFKMPLNIILFHLKHRNPGVKWLHFSWDCLQQNHNSNVFSMSCKGLEQRICGGCVCSSNF